MFLHEYGTIVARPRHRGRSPYHTSLLTLLTFILLILLTLPIKQGPSSELFRLCIATEHTVESSAVTADITAADKAAAAKRATLLFEAACRAHGEDTELWLLYIRHVRSTS
jgi:hypothetical protein